MRPDVIQLVIFANAKPALAPLSCPSCELSMTRDHFCGMKPNVKPALSRRRLQLIVFWSPGCSQIPLCLLGSCQLCLCVTGCLMVDRLLWVVHWKQLSPPPFQKKASVSSSRVKRNSKVCWMDLQSGPREAAQSADNCLRYRPDIWNSK